MKVTSLVYQGSEASNKVLRDTFTLLATTLLPTILGAFLGVSAGLPLIIKAHPWMFLIGALIILCGLLFAIFVTADSWVSIPILWAFTGFMGLLLSSILSVALKRTDGAQLIMLAALGTIAVMLSCTVYAMTTTRDFSSMGGILFGSLIGIIVVSVLNITIFHLPVLATVITAFSLLIFSAYMIYDVQQVVNGGETNYVLATVQIYLNMINIFSDLLQLLLGALSDDN